jgi:hypothetical protein
VIQASQTESLRVQPIPELTPEMAELRQEFQRFEEDYGALVEVICDSAQYGPGPKLEGRYSALRASLNSVYPRLKTALLLFLRYEEGDHDLYDRGPDAFESLFAAPTLSVLLKGDDGRMISRMVRTREAVDGLTQYYLRNPA